MIIYLKVKSLAPYLLVLFPKHDQSFTVGMIRILLVIEDSSRSWILYISI